MQDVIAYPSHEIRALLNKIDDLDRKKAQAMRDAIARRRKR